MISDCPLHSYSCPEISIRVAPYRDTHIHIVSFSVYLSVSLFRLFLYLFFSLSLSVIFTYIYAYVLYTHILIYTSIYARINTREYFSRIHTLYVGTGAQCGKEKKKIVISLRKEGCKYVVYASVLLRSGVSRYIAAISFLRISTPHEVSLDQLSETLSVKPIYQEHLRICRCSASRVSLFLFYISFSPFLLISCISLHAPHRAAPVQDDDR